jgi:hypothetical protein
MAPPEPRENNQLKSAVRADPRWSLPVGLGANLTLGGVRPLLLHSCFIFDLPYSTQ